MSRIAARRPPEQQLAEAFGLANRVFTGKFWMFAKGRMDQNEKLYGFAVFEPGDVDTVVAAGEHDDPVECVYLAIESVRKHS